MQRLERGDSTAYYEQDPRPYDHRKDQKCESTMPSGKNKQDVAKIKALSNRFFLFCNAVEQGNEWGTPLYSHFVDFEKAFEGFWKIMQSCGIPDKRIRIVQTMYDGSECAAHEDGEQTRWLKVTTGVNQSCIMSGFLFLLTIDWVMQRTTDRHRNGVRWDFTNTLEDLDSGPPCTQVRTHPGQDSSQMAAGSN